MVGIQQNVKIVETKKINKMAKYRFKTEEELKKEGLWEENRLVPIGWVLSMLPILGKEISEENGFNPALLGTTSSFVYKDPIIGRWQFQGNQVIEIIEKKMERIYKENWENYSPFDYILGVEMQSGEKFYLQPNVDGFVPVNFKDNKDYGYADDTDLETGFNNCSKLQGNKKVFKFDSMQEMIAWATS